MKFKLILFAVDITLNFEVKFGGIKSGELFFNKMLELNDDYFHLSKINLFHESQKELLDSQWDEWIENQQTKYFHDRRVNHISDDNHKIMAEYIINVIEKKELPSFKTNYKTTNELFSPRVDYIYD